MKRVAVLRGYPKDAAYQRVLRALVADYKVSCLVWDRQGGFSAGVEHPHLNYQIFNLRAGFHDLTTLLKIISFNLWLLWRLLRHHTDCIHAIDLDTGAVGLLAARLTGARFVYHCLDPYYAALPAHWPKFLASTAQWIENRVISSADLFVITDRLRLPQHQGATPKKLVEFANVPHLDVRALPATAHKDFVVGYIGSLGEGRDLLNLVDAVAELSAEDVKLVVGGFGPLADVIRERAAKGHNITFLSWVPYERLLELEADIDLFVLVLDSKVESVRWGAANPNKLFEAMAFAKPIIVGAGTLTEERVKIFGNGIAVPYGDKAALQEAIRFFRDHPDQARAMGKSGRLAFERDWTPQMMQERLSAAYEEILHQ